MIKNIIFNCLFKKEIAILWKKRMTIAQKEKRTSFDKGACDGIDMTLLYLGANNDSWKYIMKDKNDI
jgi:hypothetical protein